MGKKVKAKPKNLRKVQERDTPAASDAGSGDAASQDASHWTGEAAESASGREHCGHYSRNSAHLDKVLLEILSSKHVASCEHCREDAPRKKGGAGNKEKGGKQEKKKGGGSKGAAAKAQEKSDIWVCMDCGRHFCGGAVADTKPYGHARRHAKQDRHWWAARYGVPTVAYCLSCEKEVSIEMPKLETVVAVAVDDRAVGAVDADAPGSVNCHGNVIKGLPNLGNTCFFNAVLQNLLALERLRMKMLGPDVPTGALAMSLKKLFVETNASNDAGGALSPKNLFSSICSKYPQFRGYQMQDSHELLHCFLDGLRTEETEARKLVEDAANIGVPTIVDSIFGGQLSSTVSSTECPHSSVKHDQFLDLSLPVPSRRPPAKSISSPPAKRTKQSIRDRNKNRRYGKIPAQASPTVEEGEKIQTVTECNDSQIPGSELEQVVSEKEPEPSGCSESCASVSNQEPRAASHVEESMCWLDYVADADETKSEILDSVDSTEAGHIWEIKDAIHGSFHPQDDALSKEQILGSEHSSENTVDDAASSQPVILLSYKEYGTAAKEMDETEGNSQNPEYAAPPAVYPATENNTQPASGGVVEQDDFVGLGDMFNEPEVTSEVKKETGKAEDIDVMAWSSNSADDEVDDSSAPVSVERCLALYTEPEQLSEPWHCEHCTNADCPNINGTKNAVEMMDGASERKDGEEMMANGDKRQDGENLIMSCSNKEDSDQIMATDGCKKEDIDQIMATDGCIKEDIGQIMVTDGCMKEDIGQIMATDGWSNNVHSDMQCKEGGCANPSLADPEQKSDSNFPEIESTAIQKTAAVFSIDQTEQPNSRTDRQEQCRDLKSLAVECSSLNKQPHESTIQYNDGHNVDRTAEATSAPLSCDSDSVSCSATNNVQAECGGGAEEEVSSSLPSDAQKILPSVKDNDDTITRNQGRRKRMKMVGKAHQVQGNQNKYKEDEAKVFRAAMRRILISKAPPVLTINLNRFSQDSHGRYKKLKGHVRFKEMLDIRPFMDPRSKEIDHTTYRLVGVVEHLGSMTGGHYIAYVRAAKIGGRQQEGSGSKSWFYASDGQVRPATLEEVLNCEAYILFYERLGD